MLWFTKYNLNNINTYAEVTKLYRHRKRLHSVVMSIFGDPLVKAGRAEKSILWRIEDDQLPPYLLIQSTVPPTDEATSLPHVHSKPIILDDTVVKPDMTVVYRIAMSASYTTRPSNGHENPNPKNRLATASISRNRDRWITRAANNGLDVNSTDIQMRRVNIKNPTREPSINTFDVITGTGTITDPAAIIAAIRSGIGKHKAWGCGLLTLTPQQHQLP